jgi:polysaccharide export outer membrane protein
MSIINRFFWFSCLIAFGAAAFAQQPAAQTPANPSGPTFARQLSQYILGPNDEININAVEAEEISNKPLRIDAGGDVSLPMVGRLHAAGLTVQEFEKELTERLKTYIRQPQVSVNVTQLRSQPVTVIGSVKNPGVIQLEGRKSLVEVLSLAGGTLPEASSKLTITRRNDSGPLPLPSAKTENAYSVGEVDMRSIIDASRPEQNIPIMPNDIISVGRAPLVYAVGVLNKPGGYVLNDKQTVSVLQLIAMAGGTAPRANTGGARILRPVPGSTREEVPIKLKDIMAGKAKDVILQPEDILYVPDSYAKNALQKSLDTAIQVSTGLAIYHY